MTETIKAPDARPWFSREFAIEMRAFTASECKHDGEKELRIFTAKNNAKHIRPQCLVCGKEAGPSVAKSSVDGSALKPFDDELPKIYKERRHSEEEDIRQRHLRIEARAKVAQSIEYEQYRKTPKWAGLRRKVLTRAKHICEGCGDKPATEVHHLTYEHIFDEFLFELVALCRECHERWHGNEQPPHPAVVDTSSEQTLDDLELPCCGCRQQGSTAEGYPWCYAHEEFAEVALASRDLCGPTFRSLDPLR